MGEVSIYVEVLIIMLIAYQLLLFKSINVGFQDDHFTWKYYILMVIFTILFILSDLSYVITKNVMNLNIIVEYSINIIYYCSIAFTSAFYFTYIEYSNRLLKYKPKKINIFYYLPLFILIPIIISSPWTKAIFYIDDSGEFQRGIFYALFHINTYYFVLLAFLKTIFNYIISSNFLVKDECKKLFLTSLFILLVSIIQNLFVEYPIIHIGYLMIYVYHFVNILEKKYRNCVAKIDDITNLSNMDVLNKEFDSNDVKYVLVFSICGYNKYYNTDKFKSNFALIKFSNALRMSAIKYYNDIAKVDDGKFVMLTKDDDENKVKEIFKDVVSNIKKIEKETNDSYKMKIRVGYCEVMEGSIGFKDYVDSAFEDLKK